MRQYFLSPVFRIEKSRKYLGTCRFRLLTLKYKRKFIALGGIRKKNLNILKNAKYLWNGRNKLLKKKPA